MKQVILEEIRQTLSNLEDSDKIKAILNEAIFQKIPIVEIIEKGLRKGLEEVGKRYEGGEYFLSELLFAATLMNDAMGVLSPYLKKEKIEKIGKIVLGTVRGDIHDIGKNIFKMFAEASGFEVYDLGVDVEPEKFIEKIKETNSEILALSALLTTTLNEMKIVIDMLIKNGIREKVKVLLGGNAVTKEFAKEIGADAAALDAIEGIEICKKWVKKE
ncbi:MAG: cobalamin-dependent protein [Candidatus Methanomethylicia archaeon]